MGKNILKASLSLIVFNYLSVIVVLVMMFGFKMSFNEGDYFNLSLLNMVASLFIAIVILLINFDLVKNGVKKIKETYKNSRVLNFLRNAIIVLLTLYAVRFLGGFISVVLGDLLNLETTTIDNQTAIESMLGSAPAMMIISACLLAPISEELLFRGSFKPAIKNKWVYITVSGLTFGLSHITDSLTLVFEVLVIGIVISLIMNKTEDKNKKVRLSVMATVLLLILFGLIFYCEFGNLITKIMSIDIKEIVGSFSYIFMGMYLASVYYKEENILTTITVHALSNIISVIVLLFFA